MREELINLRNYMNEHHIDACYIPTADFHASEYVGDYFKSREYISGFTGSAGELIVTADKAGLWTDGRYFIQAERELSGSGFELYRSGMEGVPTPEEFLRTELPQQAVLAFDGRVVDGKTGASFASLISEKQGTVQADVDFVEEIWQERPQLSCKPAFELGLEYCGESREDKCAWLQAEMEKEGWDYHVLSTLDDINWLLNIRGDDVTHVPVMLSYLIINKEQIVLYAMEEAVASVRAALEESGVVIRPYDSFYDDLAAIPAEATVLIDKKRCNYRILSEIRGKIVDRENPCILRKAIKNPVELENIEVAHVKDGVAVTKFIYWLKHEIVKPDVVITETTAADKLEEFRREQGILDISFDTISAYNENAAMMHYHTGHETAAPLKPQGFLLVDSGGHYMEGTTDITRTIVLGDIPQEWKLHYTTVCKSMFGLANAKFLYGCSGLSLDILSRGPLWKLGIDYRCGTGHGVGYLLNIHEAPNGFRFKTVPERNDGCLLEEGMVTTDEPGVYIEGSHGIRIENELVCKKSLKNEYGQFMKFETITYVPIDLEAVDCVYLTDEEIEYINSYHQLVYHKIAPYLSKEEKEWLKVATRNLTR